MRKSTSAIKEIKRRYERDVIAGHLIMHYGDCNIYINGVCTCGLLDALRPLVNDAKTLYPKYWEERKRHDAILSTKYAKHAKGSKSDEVSDEDFKRAMNVMMKQTTYTQKCSTCGRKHLKGTMCPNCFGTTRQRKS